MIKARNLGKGALLSLYHCNHVWGSTNKYNIDTLTKLQKKAVRIICSVKPFSHTDGLYKELGLLKVTDIYHFLVGQFMFKYHHKMSPKLFDEYFTKHSEVHGYSTRQSELFRLPDYKKDLGRRCISFTGVKMWKKIIVADIDLDTSQPVFKSNLKRCLQHGIINVHEKWLKTTVVMVTWCYRVCYLYKCFMVFVIVAFMLCYLESLVLRLLSSMFIVLFFSICTLCTLLNEGDISETEIRAYRPLGFLSHLQYKCFIFVSM